jgi:hypothetical protein
MCNLHNPSSGYQEAIEVLDNILPGQRLQHTLAFLSIITFMVGPGVIAMPVAADRMIFLVIRIGYRLSN